MTYRHDLRQISNINKYLVCSEQYEDGYIIETDNINISNIITNIKDPIKLTNICIDLCISDTPDISDFIEAYVINPTIKQIMTEILSQKVTNFLQLTSKCEFETLRGTHIVFNDGIFEDGKIKFRALHENHHETYDVRSKYITQYPGKIEIDIYVNFLPRTFIIKHRNYVVSEIENDTF